MLHKKSVADSLMRTGDHHRAHMAYLDAVELTNAVRSIVIDVIKGDDSNLGASFHHWRGVNVINQGICCIYNVLQSAHGITRYYDAIFQEEVFVEQFANLTCQESAIWESVLGIACCGIKDYGQSIRHFRAASDIDPAIEAYTCCLKELLRLQRLPKAGQARKRLQTTLVEEFVAIMDYSPLPCKLLSPQSTLGFLDAERAVLKALGYTGPLLLEQLIMADESALPLIVKLDPPISEKDVLAAQAALVQGMKTCMDQYEADSGRPVHVLFGIDQTRLNPHDHFLKILDEEQFLDNLASKGLRKTALGFLTSSKFNNSWPT